MVNADVSSPSPFSPPGREAREPSEVGRRIADRYQIERVLHEDASTTTVSALHLTLEERVTVQVLSPEQRFDARRSAQYLEAIKPLARIKTDHVVRVLDVGVALYLGPFLVLEELEGDTLAEVLRAEGPLPVPRAVDYVLQACKGLAVAHAVGIVHRQLHPSRLLLARRGEFETLKVIDFPTLVEPGAEQRTYLAPEVMSEPLAADRRADVWSLGAVLYELVTGRSAFAPAALATATAQSDRAQKEAELSPTLRGIIARCLQPDPAQRFADVEELAAELLPLTTMNEVFRGSLTGSFSRQMMMAAAAQARAAASVQKHPRSQQGRDGQRHKGQGSERARWHSAWAALPLRRWPERWRELARRWQEQMPPGGPALSHALVAAGGLLFGLACIWWGQVTLMPPPPSQRVSALRAAPAAALAPSGSDPALAASPEPLAAAEPMADVGVAEPVVVGPAAVEPVAVEPALIEPVAEEVRPAPPSQEPVAAKARGKKDGRATGRRAVASKSAAASKTTAERAGRKSTRGTRRARVRSSNPVAAPTP
ncbi:MAG: hypothetical protein RL033_1642 [Pseudomonadota bacterium]